MPLVDVIFDSQSWNDAPEPRRSEWQQAARALLEEHAFGFELRPLRLHVSASEGASQLEFRTDQATVARVEIPARVLARHLADYAAICRRIATLEYGAGSSQLEVLDYAKRLAHDEAAGALLARCDALQTDHATARRLFTLLLTLHVDTTALASSHLRPHATRSGIGR